MATTEERHNIWVVHNDHESWQVRRENDETVLSEHRTQDEAIEAGKERAVDDEVELIVQGKDGQIVERNSYGNDPRNVPG